MFVYQRLKHPASHLLLCSLFFPCLLLAQKVQKVSTVLIAH